MKPKKRKEERIYIRKRDKNRLKNLSKKKNKPVKSLLTEILDKIERDLSRW